jgi:hypothetical protein
MFKLLNAQEQKKEPPAGPMAMTEQERLPPEPRLQSARGFGVKLENGQWINLENREPQAEYRVLHEQWEQHLNCSPRDVLGKVYCLSIDEAMQKVLEGNGLPARAPQNSSTGYEESLPTAASSGRITEKGTQ